MFLPRLNLPGMVLGVLGFVHAGLIFAWEPANQSNNPGNYWSGSTRDYAGQGSQSPTWRQPEVQSRDSWYDNQSSSDGNENYRAYAGNQGYTAPLQQPQFRPVDEPNLPQSQVFDGQVWHEYKQPLPAFRPLEEETGRTARATPAPPPPLPSGYGRRYYEPGRDYRPGLSAYPYNPENQWQNRFPGNNLFQQWSDVPFRQNNWSIPY